ncbi:MAG TPA: ABC transporter ATP-binding protein [Dehalococcoidia bacterium]|nr:ABC transporter ATP-binding protein [Dehalococcoidia bacterium]
MAEKDTVQLSIEDVWLSFHEVKALQGVSLEVKQGEILAVVGPNGAGKSCLLNVVNGFYRAQKGSVTFEGRDITRLSGHRIAALGIGRTFQSLQLYTGLSVLDNLMAGRHLLQKTGMVAAALYFGWSHKEEIEHRKQVEWLIDFLEIEAVRNQTVGSLSYGLRKRVDLGRALALEPRILLLDEPMAGMNRDEKEDIARFILDVHEMRGTTIVVIEHDMGLVMDIADRVTVLDWGQKIAEGSPEEIKTDPEVIKAFLGEE